MTASRLEPGFETELQSLGSGILASTSRRAHSSSAGRAGGSTHLPVQGKPSSRLNVEFESAGHLFHALDPRDPAATTVPIPTLFGSNSPAEVARYTRWVLDARLDRPIGVRSGLHARAYAGAAVSTIDGSAVPFEKQFYVGAQQHEGVARFGVGAWTKRGEETLGVRGDIRLELNLEGRHYVNDWIQVAAFVDAGNIWMTRPEEGRPDVEFTANRVLDDFVAAGGGIRLDFGYFLLRCDAGRPIRNPGGGLTTHPMVGEFTRQCPFLFEAGYLCHPIMSEQNPPRAEQEAEGQDGNGLGWFRRMKEGITTKTAEKKEIPKAIGTSARRARRSSPVRSMSRICGSARTAITTNESALPSTSPCSSTRGNTASFQAKMTSANPLNFKDTKDYEDRLEASMSKTGLKDAIRTGSGEVGGRQMVISAMDFGFIGGSMGSVVGEKIARAIDYSIKNGLPYVCVTKSGGARMMEAGLSLMQMAKTSARLSLLAKAGLPYVCILTDPTTGGVTASYAMLGDIHLAEPNATDRLCRSACSEGDHRQGSAGRIPTVRVLLEHGFVDRIVHRKRSSNGVVDPDRHAHRLSSIWFALVNRVRNRPTFAPLKIRPHQEHPRDFHMYLTPEKSRSSSPSMARTPRTPATPRVKSPCSPSGSPTLRST